MATGTIVDVVMPQMGVSVSEGTITKWLKSVGETVAPDETLLEISTDKVDTEVPSPAGGVLTEILVQEGETVTVGTVLARIGEAAAEAPAPAAAPPQAEPAQPPAPAVEPEAVEAPIPVEMPEPVEAAAPQANGHDDEHTFVSPVVARIAAEHGIDPAAIAGTGKGGRVTKKDILAVVESGAAPAATPAPAPPAAEAIPEPPPASPPPPAPAPAAPPAQPAPAAARPAEHGESLEPMSAMRRGIAEHMRRSLDTAAHVTSAIEVDMSKVVAIREKLKGDYVSSYGVNPTYLAFIARATVETLRDWPWVNGELRDGSIVTHSYVNLGFAVSLEEGKGLIVPVVKNAEGLNLLGMARAIADVAARARSKKLNPDDVTGGTFTITNPGSFGTFMGTPVISQPQSGILGTYAVVKRPWVIQDEAGQDAIAIRPIMNLTLTYDHRLVDGAYGAQFLRDLAHRLETWSEADY
ncbi:MAG TPA: 2-oxoglutarate dehydrogenase, E2 component, dihydrolipoamide succinyltransferase [Gaiellaceae bacterium]|nr:2-oxoglutarate dehydrogenase, E2 component, dihydrolipoamide succinyltransferase [Gaiellaceae bacterium]